MEKCSEKNRWQSMTTSARRIFRSNVIEVAKGDGSLPACTQANLQTSLKSEGITPNSEPSLDRDRELHTSSSLSEEFVHSSISGSLNGSQFSAQAEVVAEPNPIMNPSVTPRQGDRKRTLMRYITAVEELKAALSLRRPGWETFEFPEFDIIPESDESLALLQAAIEEKLNSSQELGDTNMWQKGKMLAGRLFVALSPFAKSFLTVAKGASQSVYST